jgi:putative phosphoesterase
MIKIGVISDTHLKQPDKKLGELLQGPFKDVDLIFHAGDITEIAVLNFLAGKEVVAVCGNMDSPEVRRQLPKKRLIELAGFRIGLIHGWGAPHGIEERIKEEFAEVDCLIYGHTHTPAINRRGEILFFNPGSYAGGLFSAQKSVGLLQIDKTILGEIIYL